MPLSSRNQAATQTQFAHSPQFPPAGTASVTDAYRYPARCPRMIERLRRPTPDPGGDPDPDVQPRQIVNKQVPSPEEMHEYSSFCSSYARGPRRRSRIRMPWIGADLRL